METQPLCQQSNPGRVTIRAVEENTAYGDSRTFLHRGSSGPLLNRCKCRKNEQNDFPSLLHLQMVTDKENIAEDRLARQKSLNVKRRSYKQEFWKC